MTLFEKNLSVLKQYHPDLARQIESFDKSSIKNTRVIKSLSGEPDILVGTAENHILYYGYDHPSEEVYLDVLTSLEGISEAKILFQFGFGLGYESFILSKRFVDKLGISTVLVVERNLGTFYLAMESMELSDLFVMSGFKWIIGKSPGEIYSQIYSWMSTSDDIVRVKSLEAMVTPGAIKYSSEYFLEAFRAIKTAIHQSTISIGNSPADSLQGFNNFIQNIETVALNPGIKDIEGVLKGVPAICVSAGPSLDKDIVRLHKALGKAVIIAADTTVAPLESHGIKPHVITAVERIDNVIPLLEGHDLKDTILVQCPVVKPKVLELADKVVSAYRNISHFAWSEIDKGHVPTGVSSGNLAFETAVALGCNPIILIGQDFSFDSDGNSHASGTYFGRKQVSARAPRVYAEGNFGGSVVSTETWISFLKGFERQVQSTEAKVINCSGGVKIQGTLSKSFEKVLTEDLSGNVRVKPLIEKFTSYTPDKDSLERFSQIKNRTLNSLNEIHCAMVEVQSLTESQIKKDVPSTDEVVRAIARAEEISLETWSMVLMHNVQARHLQYMVEINDSVEDDRKETLRWLNLTLQWSKDMQTLISLTSKILYGENVSDEEIFVESIEKSTRFFWPELREMISQKILSWERSLIDRKPIVTEWQSPTLTINLPMDAGRLKDILGSVDPLSRVLISDQYTINIYRRD